MQWNQSQVSSCGTHHTVDGASLYQPRFTEVLKFRSPGLAAVRDSSGAFHIKPNGSPAYDARFKRTFNFYEGVAAVETSRGWAHIDANGAFLYEDRYHWCGNFQDNRCTVRTAKCLYFHIKNDGKPSYEKRWRYAGDFRNGIAVVQSESGLSTHIEKSGQIIHDIWFIDLDVYHKGFARARDKEGWTHINVKGQPLYEQRYMSVEPFYNGQARVERQNGALEVIDENGHVLTELRPATRSEFHSLSSDMVGYWKTFTIGTAVKLLLFEKLPNSSEKLASQLRLNEAATTRLLRALGELNLVQRTEEVWYPTKRGELLQQKHSQTLADAALEFSGPLLELWKKLPQAIQVNTAWRAPDIFAQVASDVNRCPSHHRMLKSYARHDYRTIVDALDLGDSDSLVDAGGGLGVIAQLVCAKHPDITVTVLERAEVAALGKKQCPSDRIHWHEGDFFRPWGINNADVVLLSRVLHDWDDALALKILKNARAALKLGGQLIIVEMLLRDDSFSGALCDLHLFMATGGRERSISHFSQLLNSAGFQISEVKHTNALPSVIVGEAL